MVPAMKERFTAKELVAILHGLDLDFSHENLRDWHRRGILSGEPVGRGHDRHYRFDEVVYIGALAILAPHMRYSELLRPRGRELAQRLAKAIVEVYATGPDAKVAYQVPAHVFVYRYGAPTFEILSEEYKDPVRKNAMLYAWRGAVLFHPGEMALGLHNRIGDVLAQREGFADAPDKWRQERAPEAK